MPQEKKRLSDQAQEELLRRIHSGELSPGMRLPSEPELAKELGISRGILREALNALQEKGYIRRIPHGGSTILQRSDEKISEHILSNMEKCSYMELMEFREALETKSIQLVIDRASDEEIESLSDLIPITNDRGPETLDRYFHYRLAQLSQNRLFVVFIDTYYEMIRHFALNTYQSESTRKEMEAEHTRIVSALQAGNKEAAVQAVKTHLTNAKHRALEVSDANK